MEGACIIESVSLCLNTQSIIENKVENKIFMSQLKLVIYVEYKYIYICKG